MIDAVTMKELRICLPLVSEIESEPFSEEDSKDTSINAVYRRVMFSLRRRGALRFRVMVELAERGEDYYELGACRNTS